MFGLSSLELKLAALGLLLAVCTGYLAYEHHHLIAEGKASELALLKVSSDTLKAKVKEAIDQTNASHQADEKANQEKLNAALTAANSLSGALDKRVRDFDTYRRTHPDVARPPGGPPVTGGGECGTLSCGDLASELAVRGDGLARSVGELTSTLQACQRDRDSLTGLPKEIAK
jgi:hypothetical protein